jgi:AcrR family transcriptional regulator
MLTLLTFGEGFKLEEAYIENSVRTRLIISGINELEEHGIKDFSLRRTALAAQVSCAAPYRHFKDKQEFLSEIIKYIASKWELLCREIEAVFASDLRRKIIELAVANLRFWIANPNYRSVLMTLSHTGGEGLANFDATLMAALDEYGTKYGEYDNVEMKKYTVRALIYGSLMLTRADADRTASTELLRKKLEEEFPQK